MLEIDGLTIDFPQQRAVDGLSLSIEKGTTLGLVGESGSGKSMTSLAVMGLLPPSARATGRASLWGEELLGRSDAWMRRRRGEKMAMIFQDPLSSLNPYYTVGFQIAEAYRAHRGGGRRKARQLAVEAMERVRISDPAVRADHYPHQFSGGMRQRIMIAMALICEPDLIIADEPTTALDVTVQAQILELLAEVQQRTGAGMLFITHDLAVVSQICDHVTVMRHGQMVEEGTVSKVFGAPQAPYTKQLLAATPRLDDVVDLPEPIRQTSSSEPAPTGSSRKVSTDD